MKRLLIVCAILAGCSASSTTLNSSQGLSETSTQQETITESEKQAEISSFRQIMPDQLPEELQDDYDKYYSDIEGCHVYRLHLTDPSLRYSMVCQYEENGQWFTERSLSVFDMPLEQGNRYFAVCALDNGFLLDQLADGKVFESNKSMHGDLPFYAFEGDEIEVEIGSCIVVLTSEPESGLGLGNIDISQEGESKGDSRMRYLIVIGD